MQQDDGSKTLDVRSEVHEFYRSALTHLNAGGVRYLVGGAYAMECVTGIGHRTKDLDLFVKRRDLEQLLSALQRLGCSTSRQGRHWLWKAIWGEHVIDVIFGAGNGQILVDGVWFEQAIPGELFGVPVFLCPVEETIWMKSFIMERERYDGADIAHFLRARAEQLDWDRLLWRFGADWPVLLSHLILFGYIYPAERRRVPEWVIEELAARLLLEPVEVAAAPRLCRGGLLSRAQYIVDVKDWRYLDARVVPFGHMAPEDAASWSGEAKDMPRARSGLASMCAPTRHR
jgi:hypothetical protein